eukprot:c11453_g1_i1 orf=105-449(+)
MTIMAGCVGRLSLPLMASRSSALKLGLFPSSSRLFSAASIDDENALEINLEETKKWRNITIAGYTACGLLTIYNFVGNSHHEHHERPAYPYLHIRNKEFPWGPDGLFEYHKHND